MRQPLLVLLPFIAASATASSISNEVGTATTQPSDQVAQSGYVSDQVTGNITMSDTLALRFSLGLTYDEPVPATTGRFPENSGSDVFAAAAGAIFTPNDHVEIDAEADFSPPSPQNSSSFVRFVTSTGRSADADVLVRAISSSFGGLLALDLSTANDTGFDTDGNASVAVTQFQTVQNIARIANGSTVYTPRELAASCSAGTTSALLCRSLAPALRGQAAQLTQWRIGAGITETVFSNTDLTASGALYLYDTDPTQVGFFSTLSQGRSLGGNQLGAGIPLAPLVFSVRPEVGERLGAARLSVWYQYGRYYGATGHSNSIGAKLTYKFSRAWRGWLTATWQDDYQPPSNIDGQASPAVNTLSLIGALGVRYSW